MYRRGRLSGAWLLVAVFVVAVVMTLFDVSLAGLADRVEAWVHAKRKQLYFSAAPGIAVATVSRDSSGGSDLVVHAFGDGVTRLDPGSGVPVDGDTLFEIGSLSKLVTALALGALVSRGVLSFDDPLQRWLGADFAFGPHAYVSSTVTLRDLMAHRSGLAEGQGMTLGSFLPAAGIAAALGSLDPLNSFRSVFEYSTTGWTVAGEVLRAAAGTATWCDALHQELLMPLGLNSTFCSRNDLPLSIAATRLAAVHLHEPCGRGEAYSHSSSGSAGYDGAGGSEGGNIGNGNTAGLVTYDLVANGGPRDFAWGAVDAAGTVISSANDLAQLLALLITQTSPTPASSSSTASASSSPAGSPLASPAVVSSAVLAEMMTGQVAVGAEWMGGCGIGIASSVGRGLTAGLGFDIAAEIVPTLDPAGNLQPYVEKSGDTTMHKARMGLLPAAGQAVLLLGNLGGHVGGPLTALKFGALALLAGGDEVGIQTAIHMLQCTMCARSTG